MSTKSIQDQILELETYVREKNERLEQLFTSLDKPPVFSLEVLRGIDQAIRKSWLRISSANEYSLLMGYFVSAYEYRRDALVDPESEGWKFDNQAIGLRGTFEEIIQNLRSFENSDASVSMQSNSHLPLRELKVDDVQLLLAIADYPVSTRICQLATVSWGGAVEMNAELYFAESKVPEQMLLSAICDYIKGAHHVDPTAWDAL